MNFMQKFGIFFIWKIQKLGECFFCITNIQLVLKSVNKI